MIQRIWSQDPPYDLPGEFRSVKLKDAIIPELGIGYMPKPYQKPGPPISMSVSSRDRRPRASPPSKAGASSPATTCRRMPSASHWQTYSKACAEAGKPARGENWRVARNIMVAPSDAEARDRVFSERARTAISTPICARCSRASASSRCEARPGHAGREATVEVITEGCMIYGSPKTLLDKLVAFRDTVGPFGTLLMTGLDWSGPNARVGARLDAAPGARGDAEIPSARRGAGGGVTATAFRLRHTLRRHGSADARSTKNDAPSPSSAGNAATMPFSSARHSRSA